MGVAILALLHEDDMHPYEMLRLLRIRERDRLLAVTNGTLYHTVARLEAQGLITEVGVGRDGRRPERTTYALMREGNEAMLSWVRRELPLIDRQAEFRLALAEAHNLPSEEVADLLDMRLLALRTAVGEDTRAIARALGGGVEELYLIEAQRSIVLRRTDVEWLDGFLHRLRDGDIAWPVHTSPASPRYRAQRKAAQQ